MSRQATSNNKDGLLKIPNVQPSKLMKIAICMSLFVCYQLYIIVFISVKQKAIELHQLWLECSKNLHLMRGAIWQDPDSNRNIQVLNNYIQFFINYIYTYLIIFIPKENVTLYSIILGCLLF